MSKQDLFNKSIIIVAHPDDEVLWFSSILRRVDEIVFCFSGKPSLPTRHLQRQKSLSEYPLMKVSSLEIEQSETFYGVDWENPVLTHYGIKISDKSFDDHKYVENFYILKECLELKVRDFQNVFTHNPWGEYGSDEHIQVYRAIKGLQENIKFNLWFPNYVSNKSSKLMLDCICGCNFEYVGAKTDVLLAHEIEQLYKRNNCWTWYDNWDWPDQEAFINEYQLGQAIEGQAVPLNFIKIGLPVKCKRDRIRTPIRSLRKALLKLRPGRRHYLKLGF